MIKTLKHKLTLAGRKFTEAWTSCLLCMVQGDLTVLTMKTRNYSWQDRSVNGTGSIVVIVF